jgi:OOP family OmpA-OmpF porin
MPLRALVRIAALATLTWSCASTQPPAAPPAPEPAPSPVEPPPAPAPHSSRAFRIETGCLVLPGSIAFESGTTAVTADSETSIEHVVAWLAEKSDVSLARIEVHGDNGATIESTQERALALAHLLVARGVACERLIAVGFGDQKPIDDPTTPEGRARNRRVEIRPAVLRGRAIGGLPVDGGGAIAGDPCRPPR